VSGPPAQLPPPTSPALLPALAAITYVAAIVAFWGVLSLVLNRDPVDYPDAGPLLGPAMAVGGGLVTWLVLWRARGTAARALLALFGSYLAMLVVVGAGYTITRGDVSWMIVAPAHFAISPFVAGAAALAALTTLAATALARGVARDNR